MSSYLLNRGLISDESEISGIDREIHAYLGSYGKMYAVFGEKLREEAIRNAAEEMIYYGTIYGDSKIYVSKKTEAVYFKWNYYRRSGKENCGI